MTIPSRLVLEDEDCNSVPMDVVGSGVAVVRGEERIYLALLPEERSVGEESTAVVVRFLNPSEGVVCIEDDLEFRAALGALDMDDGEV